MTPSSWSEEQLSYFALTHCPGLGSKRLQRLFAMCRSWKEALVAPFSVWHHAGIPERVTHIAQDWRKTFDLSVPLQELAKSGTYVLLPDDIHFPYSIACSADPPALLYVRGILPQLPSLAIVGTRKPTSYGVQCVDQLVPALCEAGFATVAGLALGIDGHVHRKTLDSSGVTVAFLGSGVDDASLYPASHLSLAHEILEQGGAILSELRPGTLSRKEYFPQRNRLIATYSSATLVIEAAEKSGSLITAKVALDENREVFSVPGPIWSSQSEGTNNLLRLGAHVCTRAQDIFDGLSLDRPDLALKAQATLPLDPTERTILDALNEPLHQDEIGRLLQLSPANLSALITVLELKGCITSLGGNTWIKSRLPA